MKSSDLAQRIRQVRDDRFGSDVEALARIMGVPAETWLNFEAGVNLPATILLEFIAATDVEPRWLLTGEGDRYRRLEPREGHASL
jgi:hypothetical protein